MLCLPSFEGVHANLATHVGAKQRRQQRPIEGLEELAQNDLFWYVPGETA